MGKTYSIDLRERIVCGIDGGLSCRAAAVAFAVSASFAVKLKAYRAATGSVEPVRQGRPPGSGKLAPHLDFLVACVEERADITLPELAELLDAAHGVRAHPSSLSRALCAAGYSYKKNAAGLGVRTRRCQGEPADLDPPPPTPDAA